MGFPGSKRQSLVVLLRKVRVGSQLVEEGKNPGIEFGDFRRERVKSAEDYEMPSVQNP